MVWPWPLWPDVGQLTCDECGRPDWCLVVFVEHDADGKPTGPHMVQCWPCHRRDGDTWWTRRPFLHVAG